MNWDIYSKLLLKECPQDFVSYCVPGARFVSMREPQFQTRARSHYKPREMRGDSIIEANLHGRCFLIHIEWQSDKDEEMDFRLLGYCYEALRLHKLPVLSVVIYLQEVSDVPIGPMDQCIPTGRRTLWFDFDSLELSEQSVEVLRQLDLDAFYMLMLLCKDGARYEVLDEVLERLEKRNRKELIAIARFFAGKVFTSSADRKRLGRRFAMLRDFLKDSWTFQETLEEGREEGREQGLEEGREQGREQGLEEGREQGREQGLEEGREQGVLLGQKRSIEKITLARFPDLVAFLKNQLAALSNQEQLDLLLTAVSTAHTEDELKQFLTTLA